CCCQRVKSSSWPGRTRVCVMIVTGLPVVAGAVCCVTTGQPFWWAKSDDGPTPSATHAHIFAPTPHRACPAPRSSIELLDRPYADSDCSKCQVPFFAVVSRQSVVGGWTPNSCVPLSPTCHAATLPPITPLPNHPITLVFPPLAFMSLRVYLVRRLEQCVLPAGFSLRSASHPPLGSAWLHRVDGSRVARPRR